MALFKKLYHAAMSVKVQLLVASLSAACACSGVVSHRHMVSARENLRPGVVQLDISSQQAHKM